MSLPKKEKSRLDSLLVAKGLIESMERARALILAGKVLVDGIRVNKAGTFVRPAASLEIVQKMPFVSRGGLKLEGALRNFNIDVKGKVALDVGASTGGFTDCLLQRGVKKIYAVDVGYGQFAWKLRNDPKVVILEKTNIRYLDKKIRDRGPGDRSESTCLPVRQARTEDQGTGKKEQRFEDLVKRKIDIATVDVSFISLLKVIPEIIKFLKNEGTIIALIKPQFEVTKKDVGKGGVVRDEAKRLEVIEKITEKMSYLGLEVKEVIKSRVVGPKGNIEYFMYLVRSLDQQS